MFPRIAIALMTGTLLSAPALAQTTPVQPQGQAPVTIVPEGVTVAPAPATGASTMPMQGGDIRYVTENRPDLWRASRLEGMNVYNENNEKVGDIREVLVNSTGQVEAVVIGVGGFLGIGERDVAVPYDALEWVQDDRIAMTATGTPGTGMGVGGVTGAPATDTAGAMGTGTTAVAPITPGADMTATAPATEPTTTGAIGADDRMAMTAGDRMRDYPERAILRNATREQLEDAPQFEYAR
ncbi:PRC-barrel domain-containing protein [Microvirga roseola]|uniref:PRC-barrel domain-containing protein n=1 Tax=Microvirga roseola TaxID=2883126 RepID=UPI001E5D3C48|nr:PRC-barrel domain-containing protein [Microvirga roseola]